MIGFYTRSRMQISVVLFFMTVIAGSSNEYSEFVIEYDPQDMRNDVKWFQSIYEDNLPVFREFSSFLWTEPKLDKSKFELAIDVDSNIQEQIELMSILYEFTVVIEKSVDADYLGYRRSLRIVAQKIYADLVLLNVASRLKMAEREDIGVWIDKLDDILSSVKCRIEKYATSYDSFEDALKQGVKPEQIKKSPKRAKMTKR